LKKWNTFALEADRISKGEEPSKTIKLPVGTTPETVRACFNESSVFPVSYRLYEKDECRRYFEILNSMEYPEMKKESEV